MSDIFLQAEWRKLIMANYAVDASVLAPYVPPGTELDLWNNTCYVSLVGFMFLNTKVKGFSIPLHKNFEEVNLRFYVRYKTPQGEWKRGVVFVKEIVPKPMISFVANVIYDENYETLKMDHEWKNVDKNFEISYRWKKERWHSISVTASSVAEEITSGSEAEFITEHYWGYTKTEKGTHEYEVRHPRWKVYPVQRHKVDVNFGVVYGKDFQFLEKKEPVSVFLAEGSEIKVMSGNKIQTSSDH